jgi:Uncharacterized protein conserved in bacteria
MKAAPFSFLVVTALLLSGCMTGPRPETRSFLLDPGQPPKMESLATGATASVTFVDVGAPFSSPGFVYQLSADRWEVDPYNQFLVSPADMFTGILRQWIRESGLYRSIALPDEGGGQMFVIDCDVTGLCADFQDRTKPRAILRMEVQVFRRTPNGRELVLDRTFDQSISFEDRRPQALVDAWNEALRLNLEALLGALAAKAR